MEVGGLMDTPPRTEKKTKEKEKKNAHNRRTLAYGNVLSMKRNRVQLRMASMERICRMLDRSVRMPDPAGLNKIQAGCARRAARVVVIRTFQECTRRGQRSRGSYALP